MKLDLLLKNMKINRIVGDIQREVNGIAYDSRKVEEGFVFVCIPGFKVDGHDYIKQAHKNGASSFVVERIDEALSEWVLNNGLGLVVVDSTRFALAKMANTFYLEPSKKLKLIGVTGTNGKTSIAQMLTHMLEGIDEKCAVLGTIENRILNKVYSSEVTTPESLELNALFYEMNQQRVAYCTMEVSSHALELQRVTALDFDYGIFTNLTKDHLDFHETMDAYFEAKAILFKHTQKANIINVDDPYGLALIKSLVKEKKSVETLTYGLEAKADITALKIQYNPTGSTFILKTPRWELDVAIPIPGRIYIQNFLAAVSVLYSEELSKTEISKAVQFIKPIPGRLEPIINHSGINVIVDFAHTPDSLENVLSVARSFTKGRLITVFGCGGDRDVTKRPEMGRIATELSDFTFVTSDNPRTEDPEMILQDILEGIERSHSRFKTIVDRKAAITEAIRMANPSDTVLIAGKGHETYQIIGTQKYHFDDREIAREVLEA